MDLHQHDISKVQLANHDIKSKSYKFYKLKADPKSPLLNTKFVIDELNINKDDFDVIYKSFDYNQYSDTNDGYYYYSGDINNPKEFDKAKIDNRLPKFSNIIGCSTGSTTDTPKNLKSKLSRIIINLML